MYKIYVKGNYLVVVDELKNEYFYGKSKEVFIDKNNLNKPEYKIFGVKDLKDGTILSIPNILKEAGTAYTESEFDAFYQENTGNFNGGGIAPYKVYEANLTQSGGFGNPPIPTIQENTIGTLTPSRVSAGVYKLISAGLFTVGKTTVIINQTNPLYNITAKILDVNEIQINTRNYSVGLDADNVLLDTTIIIKVFN